MFYGLELVSIECFAVKSIWGDEAVRIERVGVAFTQAHNDVHDAIMVFDLRLPHNYSCAQSLKKKEK